MLLINERFSTFSYVANQNRSDFLSKLIDRTGEVFDYGEWRKYKIIKYVNAHDVTIKFLDDYGYEKKVSYDNCKKNNVQNPYERTSCNVGYLGVMKDGSLPVCTVKGKSTREYKLWCQMIERCYGTNSKDSYKNCFVCDRWLCFVNFLEDIPLIDNYELWLDNPKQHIALDKDLKQPNSEIKFYSLETCTFTTIQDNTSESSSRQDQKCRMKTIYGINIYDDTKIEFESIKAAENYFNVSHGTIRHAINKERPCKDYMWFRK